MASNARQTVSIQKTAYSLLCLRLVLKASSFSHSARIFSSGKEYVSGRDESISPVQLMSVCAPTTCFACIFPNTSLFCGHRNFQFKDQRFVGCSYCQYVCISINTINECTVFRLDTYGYKIHYSVTYVSEQWTSARMIPLLLTSTCVVAYIRCMCSFYNVYLCV